MLSELTIENLGIIETAQLEFSPRLTVLSGETGAGKTMVLSSLALLTGGKADTGLIRAGAEEVCATALVTNLPRAAESGEANGGRVEADELLLSRVVRATRSRAFIGGRPVTAASLQEVGSHWVKIHGQSEQLKLRSASQQLAYLDRSGGQQLAEQLQEHRQNWETLTRVRAELVRAQTVAANRGERLEYLENEIALIDKADPYPGEEEELVETIERLTNVEQYRGAIASVATQIGGFFAQGSPSRTLQTVANSSGPIAQWADTLAGAEATLNELSNELGSYLANLEEDPQLLDQSHERLALLRSLLSGRAASVDDLLKWREDCARELAELANAESNLEVLTAEVKEAEVAATASAAQLTRSRKKLAQKLAKRLEAELADLAMADTAIEVEVSQAPLGSRGADQVRFMMRAKHDVKARELAATASGGELSRIMLALEVASVSEDAASGGDATLIFDEIDAGIGGATALAVGKRLAQLAKSRQVIVVTHLAQVACYGQKHLVVQKSGGETSVVEVSGEERVNEIARMLSGKTQSNSARAHAAELLNGASVE